MTACLKCECIRLAQQALLKAAVEAACRRCKKVDSSHVDVVTDCWSAMQLHAVLDAARAHHAELTFIAEHLPQYLPGQTARPSGDLPSHVASLLLTSAPSNVSACSEPCSFALPHLCILRWGKSQCHCQHTQESASDERLSEFKDRVQALSRGAQQLLQGLLVKAMSRTRTRP